MSEAAQTIFNSFQHLQQDVNRTLLTQRGNADILYQQERECSRFLNQVIQVRFIHLFDPSN